MKPSKPDKTHQVHVRVSSDFKKALKMFCVRNGTTEQAWILRLIQAELTRKAPDLWASRTDPGPMRKRGK